MKMGKLTAMCVALVFAGGLVQAGTLQGSGSRESLLASDSLHALSLGANYETINRDVQLDDESVVRLEALAVSAFLGYDIVPWLTPFVTLGGAEAKPGDDAETGDQKLKWSVGANLNLWHVDVVDPEFMEGRFSIRGVVEYAQYNSETTWGDLSWDEIFVAMPLTYELYVESMEDVLSFPYSLVLSAGPALSMVQGTLSERWGDTDFEEDQMFGLVAGADLFISHNLSLGCQYEHYFDSSVVNGTLRYHF